MKLVRQASNCTRALVKLSVNDPFRPYLLEVVLERLPLRLRHRRDVAQSHAIWRGHRALVLTLFQIQNKLSFARETRRFSHQVDQPDVVGQDGARGGARGPRLEEAGGEADDVRGRGQEELKIQMKRCTYGKSGGVGAENCGIKWGMKGGRRERVIFKVAAREKEDGRSLGWGGAAANLKFRLLSPPPPPPPSRTFQPRFKGEYSTTAHKRPAAATWEMVGRRGGEKKKATPSVFLWGKIYSREVLLKRCGTFKPMPQNFCLPSSFCFLEERLGAVKENTLFFQQTDGSHKIQKFHF